MKKIFIYNKCQALYYINEFKCKVIDFGFHDKSMKPFVVFDREETNEAYKSWCGIRCK